MLTSDHEIKPQHFRFFYILFYQFVVLFYVTLNDKGIFFSFFIIMCHDKINHT